MSRETTSGRLGDWQHALGAFVNHDDPLVRFAALWTVLLAGLGLLAVANYREALAISRVVG